MLPKALFPTLSLLLALLLAGGRLPAQPTRNCGTMHYLEAQQQADPGLKLRMRQIEQSTQYRLKSAFDATPARITIPVVVHVVYRTPAENISDEQIRSQIAALNRDFLRQNPDSALTLNPFKPLAASTGIAFRLAEADPKGQPTTGITRTRTSRFSFLAEDNAVKFAAMGGADAWPASDYLNIWVCNLGGGMLGYSQFPGGPPETDGVVIGYPFFGASGPLTPPFDMGRTATHEVGHWLNLRHIWGDGPCDVDDFVEDTPPANRPNQGCLAVAPEACGGPMMFQNYMDYTDDACMNLFTQGQAARMRALFAPGGARHPILASGAFRKGETAPPLADAVPAGLTVSEIGPESVRLAWEAPPGAEGYRVQMRRAGGKWEARPVSQPSIRVSRLSPCTDYEFQVEALYPGRTSGYSAAQAFRTACQALLAAPGGLRSQLPGGSSARLSWSPVAGAQAYELQYKASGSRQPQALRVARPEALLEGLSPGRYLWRVRAADGSGQGPYSTAATFVVEGQALSRVAQAAERPWLQAAPLSAPGRLRVFTDADAPQQVELAIVNPEGQVVQRFDPYTVQPGIPFELPLAALRAGDYFLQAREADGFVHEAHFRVE
jgi:hypothetical protein